jgi:O-antigen/teichoic acid export membrane protein
MANGQTYQWSRKASPSALAANAFIVAISVGSSLSLACWVLSVGPARHLFHLKQLNLLGLALISIPFCLMFNYFTNLLVLGDRLRKVNVANIIGAIGELIAIVVLVCLHRLGLTTMVLVWLGSLTVPAVILFNIVRPKLHSISWPLLRETLTIGLKYHPGSLLLYLLLNVDILLLSDRVDHAQVGLYSLAVTLAQLVFLVNAVLSQVMQPRQVDSSMVESGVLTVRLVRLSFMAATCTIGLVLAISPFAIPLIYGAAYKGCIPSLLALGPGIIAFGMIQPTGIYLTRLNRPILMSVIVGGTMAINVLLNLLLIPHIGIVGSALASTAAYSILAAIYLEWLRRSAKVSLSAFLPRSRDVGEILRRRIATSP